MDRVIENLTVFFEKPFWAGVFECISDNSLTFGPAAEAELRVHGANPKKMQREAKKQTRCIGLGTKSQQTLSPAREQLKSDRRRLLRKETKRKNQRRFELRQQKRKEKHRSR